ncbi:uncharacterized protein YnzC (UPF0291/DUF896 family) [Desulfohalotomaculum tongense]|uniref:hypothetical protein n=1 Tax=Desulforadius tongensis TaxID=1216062 RepID=UPI00195BC532|nr:hypothetical protein [Desulforadius tongensis]MBM7855755.1 uncharacterized protein YnzC (UPF0291/DUF896 family) [Desulforadius tongensis]
MGSAYSIIEIPLVNELAKKLEEEGMSASEVFKFKIDMTYYVNFLRTYLNKDLEQSNELDLEGFKQHLRRDFVFLELEERRIKNVQLGLQKLKEAQSNK